MDTRRTWNYEIFSTPLDSSNKLSTPWLNPVMTVTFTPLSPNSFPYGAEYASLHGINDDMFQPKATTHGRLELDFNSTPLVQCRSVHWANLPRFYFTQVIYIQLGPIHGRFDFNFDLPASAKLYFNFNFVTAGLITLATQKYFNINLVTVRRREHGFEVFSALSVAKDNKVGQGF